MRSTFARTQNLTILFIFVSLFLFSVPSFAASVAAVKNNKVLVKGNVQRGKLYYTTYNGKRTGVIRITKVQGNKAIGMLLKGKAIKGAELALRPSKKKSNVAKKAAYEQYSYDEGGGKKKAIRRNKELAVGGVLGMVQSSANVSFNTGEKASLSGSGISIKAMGDYSLTNHIFLRGYVGTQPFEAKEGNRTCIGVVNCVMSINYLAADIWGRYIFNPDSNMRFWGGVGAGLLFPLNTGNTNAVVKSDISSTMVFQVGGGLDWFINDKFFIPVLAEYNLIPPSDDVKTSMISIRAGLGMKL
ncbi:MAG: porin family protein [Bdellovibrionaceae bacterium]|nr:porin family protein [Pseudobdellovibrionaceae bacterium]